ncbi:MAG: hypothetical protein V2J19_09325 [Wenzhouxiangella sp.]|nr:hypothetical protein [Wenzhouxiangella sp.]
MVLFPTGRFGQPCRSFVSEGSELKQIAVALGVVVALAGAPSGQAAVADLWYLTFDPIDAVAGTQSGPQEVVSYDPGTGSAAPVRSLTEAPVEIDGFERLDADRYYFSTSTHAQLDGLTVAPGDVVLSESQGLSLAFDASAEDLPASIDVDAVAVNQDDELVLSVDTHVQLDGIVFEDADLFRFDGSAFHVYFDAGAAGLPDHADVDAATSLSAGRIVISTRTGGRIQGTTYDHGSLLLIDGDGTFASVQFDASDASGTTSDIVSLSAEPVGDAIFSDRFQGS